MSQDLEKTIKAFIDSFPVMDPAFIHVGPPTAAAIKHLQANPQDAVAFNVTAHGIYASPTDPKSTALEQVIARSHPGDPDDPINPYGAYAQIARFYKTHPEFKRRVSIPTGRMGKLVIHATPA
jgi:hypothetical protein